MLSVVIVLRRPSTWLVVSSWVSAALFAVYVLANYLGALFSDLERWNVPLPRLYDASHPAATVSIGAHFATGALLLLLAPLQLLGIVRERWPALHRWLGRVTVVAAALTGLAGLGFIVAQGTIGGAPMNVGFGLYGLLMTLAAVQTARFARARELERHRRWALRLYALIIGSWLYRMEYGFLFALARGAGHSRTFDAAIDVVMSFFFYVPNLLLVELSLRAGALSTSRWRALALDAVMVLATLLVLVGTWFFAANLWGPAILEAFGVVEG
jgi:uncharacterized membrane protein